MARLRSIRRPLRRFAQAGRRRRALVVEAVCLLLLARLALVLIPFPRLAHRLGTFVAPDEARAVAAGMQRSQELARLAEDVGWAVTRSARYLPFKAVCLPQAIAARMMLARRGVGSVLHFGAANVRTSRPHKPLDAHAWLDAAGVKVTGYPAALRFSEIACFV
ncbi:MAG: lasso peptide biosynthesis B2 protein [Pseudolabrys sp.]|nr:lasso peptide biosynthesis B2 protein [Pseudolabrys sp.]